MRLPLNKLTRYGYTVDKIAFSKTCPQNIRDIICGALNPDPQSRWTVQDIGEALEKIVDNST